jgi:hypothetical protein
MTRYSTWMWVLGLGVILVVVAHLLHTRDYRQAAVVVGAVSGSMIGLGIGIPFVIRTIR